IVELSLEGRMREADVGSPSADTGRAISDHRMSCPGLIWRRGSQSLMGNFGGSNRSSRWHWHQPRKGRCSDTDDHLSVRANVFRVAPESGHAETEAPCPKSARSRHQEGAGIRPRSETANAISSKPASENQIIAYRMCWLRECERCRTSSSHSCNALNRRQQGAPGPRGFAKPDGPLVFIK